ncbi:Na+/H+ antiporter [Saxophila tyrrhenica]|uniref:Na+/H+ antiporter n=1 Tax=Saxophila tyrrhenica TaxID=1690608 RepID=A0AAV9P541_9PEZI|nr:Na+/H+ antiporter [Saxophila tyrrhenica]
MAWEHLSVNKPHLVYLILGGFTTLFMLCSSIIKERLYIGEATVATLCGIIFGPHAANLIDPLTWGNTDQITLEFSRIVLVVQCFAVGVELPKHYMEKHWRSVTFLLIPVMTFGWLVTSLFIWAVFHQWANWLDCLCIAACVTATDPVLASSVVGKGKFAKRVPKHLRDLLSCESGCNDGMAFPFVYLAIYIIRYKEEPEHVALHWFCYTILYECIFGATYGLIVGYIARRLIRAAHERDYIDRESFLVFYFVLALFCAGSGALLGTDDLLVGFACGVGFSNDGWFTEKTEESHVSNVIDLLINLTFFVYFGTIIPWDQFNAAHLGLDAWRLVVIALLVLFFRRIPIMLCLKPVIPDIKTWREALFAGHFGPIGVGAIFVAILARAELETEETTPLAVLPEPGFPHRNVIELIWPITAFLVITSILVHGSSIAVFTLGKHINTLTLTMSYSKAVDEPNWMERLPRIQSRSKSSMSARSDTDFEVENEKGPLPPGMLPAVGRGPFLRRQKEEDNPSRVQSRSSSRHRPKHSKNWETGRGPGGPISQSAIKPQPRDQQSPEHHESGDSDTLAVKSEPASDEQKDPDRARRTQAGEIYEEGEKTVYEDEEGNVLAVEDSKQLQPQGTREEDEQREGRRLMHAAGADRNRRGVASPDWQADQGGEAFMDRVRSWGEEEAGKAEKEKDKVEDYFEPKTESKAEPAKSAQPQRPGQRWREGVKKMSTKGFLAPKKDEEKATLEPVAEKTHGPARAYQFGNTIIVEDEDGEVIKKYDIPAPDRKQSYSGANPKTTRQRLQSMGTMLGMGEREKRIQAKEAGETAGPSQPAEAAAAKPPAAGPDDEENLRFTITTGGRRMSKADFIDAIRDMDPKRRVQAVEDSNAPEGVKREARAEAREQAAHLRRGTSGNVPVVNEQPEGEDDRMAEIEKVATHETDNDLRLVDSENQQVPFHDVSRELRNYSMNQSTGETAAERRRREALQDQNAGDSDSEDDGTDRVPPKPVASSSTAEQRQFSDTGETAAERRRREGALGLREEESSDSEDDNEPRQLPQGQAQNVRFADQAEPKERPARQSVGVLGCGYGDMGV